MSVVSATQTQRFLEQRENRTALRLFGRAELRIFDRAVLHSLAEQHASLRGTRSILLRDFDPVSIIYQWETGVKVAKQLARGVDVVTRGASSENAHDVRYIAENIGRIAPEYEAFSRGEKETYARVAQTINALALPSPYHLEALVQDETFRDNVLRAVFPEQTSAEQFFSNYVRVARLFPESAAAMKRIVERTRVIRELPGIEYIPTKEASEALLDASERYIERRLAEVYA